MPITKLTKFSLRDHRLSVASNCRVRDDTGPTALGSATWIEKAVTICGSIILIIAERNGTLQGSTGRSARFLGASKDMRIG